MEITHQFTRPRKEFGRQTRFVSENAQMLADLRPNEERAKMFVLTVPKSTGVQAGPLMSEHQVNTDAVVLVSKGMWHTEGGWPKDVDCTEVEQTTRYIRKVEKDEHYIRSVVSMCATAEEIINQNNAIDIYEEYWADLDDTSALDTQPASMSIITQLKDPHAAAAQRAVQSVSWHPDGSQKIAVAFSRLTFTAELSGAANAQMESYSWDLEDPNIPEAVLAPASPVVSIHYSPRDSKLMGAGLYNGQFSIFDTRRGSHPVDSTSGERSHRDPVYDFAWMQTKGGAEAMTISTDGRVLWWDMRHLSEPSDELLLQNKGADERLGAISLEYNPAVGPTRFMVGTEEGCILSCNRAKGQADRISAIFDGQQGGICGVERNPFHPKYLITCGDWTTRMWNEDLRTPISGTPSQQARLASICWSATRPGVYFTARADGLVDTWDILLKGHRTPSLSYQVASDQLNVIRSHANGRLLASGGANGKTCILGVSDALAEALPQEKGLLLQTLEGETLQEKNLEKAQKEAKVRARKEGAKSTFVQSLEVDDQQYSMQVQEDFREALAST